MVLLQSTWHWAWLKILRRLIEGLLSEVFLLCSKTALARGFNGGRSFMYSNENVKGDRRCFQGGKWFFQWVFFSSDTTDSPSVSGKSLLLSVSFLLKSLARCPSLCGYRPLRLFFFFLYTFNLISGGRVVAHSSGHGSHFHHLEAIMAVLFEDETPVLVAFSEEPFMG